MQIIKKKGKYEKLFCNICMWEAWPMWILNICVFASASENGALILCLKKLILKI